jgi:hypothetical protein
MVCATAQGGRQNDPMAASQQQDLLVDILYLHASEERETHASNRVLRSHAGNEWAPSLQNAPDPDSPASNAYSLRMMFLE